MALASLDWSGEMIATRSATSSGASLHDLYLTKKSRRTQPGIIPIIVTGTPGARRWIDVPALTIGAVTPTVPGIQGMIAIDNPTYGRRVFGVSSQYQFFEVRFGGTGANDPPADYDPFKASSPDSIHVANATRVVNFTTDINRRAVGAVRLVASPRRILFVIGRDVYMWDMAANSGAGEFQTVIAPTPTDAAAGLPDEEWVDVAWIDGYFFLAARNGELFHSNINSDQFDQLDVAEANSNADENVGLAVYARRLYVFGRRTVEQWWNSPRGTDFAFRRDNSWVANVGCASRDSIQSNEFRLFFLGSNGIVYSIELTKIVRLSNDDIERDIKNSYMNRARGFTYTEEGHRFYSLTLFMKDGSTKNWTLDTTEGYWHTRSVADVYAVARFDNLTYVGREDSQSIQSLSLDWGTDINGDAIAREGVLPVVYASDQRFRIHSLHIELRETGTGTIQLAKSLDARATWENVGAERAFDSKLVLWNDAREMEDLIVEDQINLRFTITADVRVELVNSFVRAKAVP